MGVERTLLQRADKKWTQMHLQSLISYYFCFFLLLFLFLLSLLNFQARSFSHMSCHLFEYCDPHSNRYFDPKSLHFFSFSPFPYHTHKMGTTALITLFYDTHMASQGSTWHNFYCSPLIEHVLCSHLL